MPSNVVSPENDEMAYRNQLQDTPMRQYGTSNKEQTGADWEND